MNKSVLDASALLAYLRDEPGAEIVENALIDGCYISIINWVEVLSKVVDLGESPDEIIKRLRDEGLLPNSLEIIACSEEDAIIIAKFRSLTKSAGLSLGDRACLALGKRLNLAVLTADKVPGEEQLVDTPYQFSLSSNEHGRVHGFFIEEVFFIVWLDPNHKLYS